MRNRLSPFDRLITTLVLCALIFYIIGTLTEIFRAVALLAVVFILVGLWKSK